MRILQQNLILQLPYRYSQSLPSKIKQLGSMVGCAGISFCLCTVANWQFNYLVKEKNLCFFLWTAAFLCGKADLCETLGKGRFCDLCHPFFPSQGGYLDRCPNYPSEPTCEGAPGCHSSQCSGTGGLLWLPWCPSGICAWPLRRQRLREHVWVGKEVPTEQNTGKETSFLFLFLTWPEK